MTRGMFAIGIDNPKTKENIASVIRAAGCYGASMVAATGMRYKRSGLDTAGHAAQMPVLHNLASLLAVIPFGAIPVAVELCEDAESLVTFEHPRNAFYIFGAEDNTLGARVLDWCPRRVMIPTRHCMNLAACVNVVLYDRLAKETLNKEHDRAK